MENVQLRRDFFEDEGLPAHATMQVSQNREPQKLVGLLL